MDEIEVPTEHLHDEINEYAKEQKENRCWYLEEKEWTGELINQNIIEELNNNDYLIINEQELEINMAEILLMINQNRADKCPNHLTSGRTLQLGYLKMPILQQIMWGWAWQIAFAN